ncbi:hypothetical protein [Octadecabacter antarcticus]|uniref:hypothetical protein n=1 Tax=Octadecabacter antarcticus TaxID=1217908 RepID=UPI0016512052|nr:hypothetical protein [Octadecabacter antarcticus]
MTERIVLKNKARINAITDEQLGRVGHRNHHEARRLNFAWLKPGITSPRIIPAGWHPMLF